MTELQEEKIRKDIEVYMLLAYQQGFVARGMGSISELPDSVIGMIEDLGDSVGIIMQSTDKELKMKTK